jgi:hypothetical protein
MPVSPLFLRQQLEYVQNTVVEQDFPERIVVSGELVPVSSELPAAAETYSYRIMTAVGEAAILANGAEDIPMVTAFVEKRTGEIKTIVDGYEYTIEDIEAAEFANMNLDTSMAVIAREVMEAKADQLGYDGDSSHNLLGLLNHPNVPSGTVAADGNQNGGTNSTRWIHKTAAQIYRDLSQFGRSARTATNGVEFFDTIALPEDQYNILAETPYPDTSTGNTTILSFYLDTQSKNPKGVRRIMSVPYLTGKGAGSTDLMLGLRKQESKIKYHIPMDFTQEAPQQRDLKIRVVCRMRTGGAQLIKPMSMGYRSGI